jgi:phage baseplate assembly protein W
VSVTYQLTSPPAAAPLPPNPIALVSTSILGSTVPAFLGAGLVRPFTRDQKNDFANANGLPVIQACVGQILGTKASDDAGINNGEVPWRPTFGSRLYLLQHRKGPHLAQMARVYVVDALAKWEPRVTNVRVSSAFFPSQYLLQLDLLYDVIARNVPGNQVLFPGVQQQVAVPMAA